MTDNNTCVTTGEATKFAEDLISEYDNEQLRVSNDTQGSKFNNWDFDTSIFFVITVITTIGKSLDPYRSMVCLTTRKKKAFENRGGKAKSISKPALFVCFAQTFLPLIY